MLWTVLYGGIVLAFAPLAVAVVAFLGPNPALAVLAMATAFFTLMVPLQLTGIAYVITVAAGSSSSSSSSSGDGGDPSVFSSATARRAEAGKAWFVVFGVVFHCVARVLFAWLIIVADRFFRTHHQVLFASGFRLLPVGIACGIGASLVGAVLPFGALAQAASQLDDPWIAVAPLGVDAVFINWDVCPQMPYVAFAALSTALTSASGACWYGVTMAGVAAILGERDTVPPPVPPPPPLPPPPPAVDEGDRQETPNERPVAAAAASSTSSGAGAPQVSEVDDGTVPGPDERRGDDDGFGGAAGASEEEVVVAADGAIDEEAEEEKEEGPPSSPIPPEARRVIPAPTSLSRPAGLAAVLGAAALHFASSLVTLLNDGAFDWQSASSVAGRGCTVTLPVQAVVLLLSVAAVVGIAARDVAPLPQPDEQQQRIAGDEGGEGRSMGADAVIGVVAATSLQPVAPHQG